MANIHETQRSNPWFLFDIPRAKPIYASLAGDLRVHFAAARVERDWRAELGLSEELYNRYIAGKPYQQAFQTYLDVSKTVSDIHRPFERINPLSKRRSVGAMNSIRSNLAEMVAMDYAEIVPDSYSQNLIHQFKALERTKDAYSNWFYPKVFGLWNALERWGKTHPILDGMRKRLAVQVEGANSEEMKELGDRLWEKTMQNQSYGVKSCYFNSPLFLPGGTSFYFLEPEMESRDDPKNREVFHQDSVAILGLGEPPTGALGYRKEEYKATFPNKTKVDFTMIFSEGGELFQWFDVLRDGRILSMVDTDVPVERGFLMKGMKKEYEYWRLFIMMRLHDLIGPSKKIDSYPSIDDFEWDAIKKGKTGRLGLWRKEKKIDFRPLVLPRINPAEPEKSEPGEKRFVDKHKVTWFTRNLPKGYHVTQRAIDYASEHKIVLKEGETIVREHERGTRFPKNLPHKVINRENGDATHNITAD